MNNQIRHQVGNYRLSHMLGRGGFAEVYLGEHVHLRTQAAIKVLREPVPIVNRENFLNEARLIASLIHPHIVRVLDFGIDQQQGLPFLVMDYAPNGSLRQRHPRGVPVALDLVVHYVKQAAEALQYAHRQRYLDNTRLVHRDVKPENMLLGRNNELLISDFGIAVIVQSTDPSNLQDSFGTPLYMAPEQIHGKPKRASDQYALGITVYEWLTGTYPFNGDTIAELARQHLEDPPPPLRARVPSLPDVVDRVVRQALAKNPKERFTDVQEFAIALEQASNHVLEESPPEGILYIYREHSAPVKTLDWSPDGQRIVSASTAGQAHVWDAASGGNGFIYSGHTRPINSVAWSRDGQYIASGGQGHTVRIWNADTGKDVIRPYRYHTSSVTGVSWSPDSHRIASSGQDKTVQVWNSRNRTTFSSHSSDVLAVAWSLSGKYIVSASSDRTVHIWVWDPLHESHIRTYREHTSTVKAVIWSPDEQYIASAGNDKSVRVWEALTLRTLLTYDRHADHINALSWSPDGRYIASASQDGTVQVWSAINGSHVFTYYNHTGAVYVVVWSPDGKRIASGSADGTVHVWRVFSRSP